MAIKIELPESLPHGHGATFKKGIIDVLLKSATVETSLEHTPEGQPATRKLGNKFGKLLVSEIAKIVKK